MSTIAIVLLVLGALLVILIAGGAIAATRRRTELAPLLSRHLDEANQELAAAHANDNGWEPAGLEAAARAAWAAEHPDVAIADLDLVAVLDPPGIDQDKAVFRVRTSTGTVSQLILGRRADGWVAEAVE